MTALKSVSGVPSYESYSWGSRISVLALITYSAFSVLRLFSPLQWYKFIKRSRCKPTTDLHSSIERKPRTDFHAADTETYFGVVLLVTATCWALSAFAGVKAGWRYPSPLWSRVEFGIVTLLLVESIQWTFYYSLFRSLMERARLNTYDEAEYLVMLPPILGIQVLAFAALWQLRPIQILMLIFNVSSPQLASPQPWQALATALLGQSYIVIIIASLIRVVPPLHVRKRPNITVIGCGDVVRKRILPALLAVYSPRQIAVAADRLSNRDLRFLKKSKISNYFSVQGAGAIASTGLQLARESCSPGAIEKIAAWAESRSRFAIIATPTPTHLDYALELARRGLRFAIEKPLIGTDAELRLLMQDSSKPLFDNAFVLSYYWLEKALSLNYLLSLHPAYRPLLNLEPAMAPQEISFLRTRLGRLQQVTIEFLEGEETQGRYWSELMRNGGMVMETLIHPVTLLFHLVRSQSPPNSTGLWAEPPVVHWFRNEDRAQRIQAKFHEEIGPTCVEIAGIADGGIDVMIRCGKYQADQGEEVRRLVARYEHGWITSDLGTMETRVFYLNGWHCENPLRISNKSVLLSQKNRKVSQKEIQGESRAAVKYQFQVDMLNTFFLDGWGGLRFDDYPDQIAVLQELMQFIESAAVPGTIRTDVTIQRTRWLDAASLIDPSNLEPPQLSATR